MTKRTLLLLMLVGVLLTVVFYFLGALFSGGGHSLAAMTAFFPFGMMAGIWSEDTSLEFTGDILLVIQFPLYALILANVKGSWRWLVLFIILSAHIIFVTTGLKVYRSSRGQNYIGSLHTSELSHIEPNHLL